MLHRCLLHTQGFWKPRPTIDGPVDLGRYMDRRQDRLIAMFFGLRAETLGESEMPPEPSTLLLQKMSQCR